MILIATNAISISLVAMFFLPGMTDFRSSLHFIDASCKLHPRSRDVSWFNSNFSLGSALINLLFLVICEIILYPRLFFRVACLIMISLICMCVLITLFIVVLVNGNLTLLCCKILPFVTSYCLVLTRAGALYTKSPVTSLRTVFCTFIPLAMSLSGLKVHWFDGLLL